MNNFQQIKNILIKFKNKDITQDAAEDQLLELIESNVNRPISDFIKIDYSKLDVDYNKLAKSIILNTPTQPIPQPVVDSGNKITITWEKDILINALKQEKFNRKRVSKLLGVSERTIYRKLNIYDIDVDKLKIEQHVS